MPVPEKQRQSRWWAFCVAGALGGGLFGIFSGPIAMFGAMCLNNYLYGTVFLGLELIVSPVLGAILGVLDGATLGILWVFLTGPDRRLTIARLMLIVAVSGPTLAFFMAGLIFGSIALFNALLLVPVAIGVMMAVEKRKEERSRSGRTSTPRNPSYRHESDIIGLSVRFSDWGDPNYRT
jgi:hypothetical protein